MNYQWYVCEPESRWLRLSRRFAPQMLPSTDDSVSIVSLDAPRMVARLTHGRSAVALWSLETDAACGPNLTQLGFLNRSPQAVSALHFVAVDPRLGQDARLALATWGVVILDRPEQLSRYTAMVSRFWRAA